MDIRQVTTLNINYSYSLFLQTFENLQLKPTSHNK